MKDKEKIILYVGGTFDLFHYGHVRFLKRCKSISDYVVVALNSDDFVAAFKTEAPLLNYEERRECLEGCRYVDQVIKHTNGLDSKPTILAVKPSIIAVGSDWKHKDYFSQMSFDDAWLRQNKIELIYLDYTSAISSTKIKERLITRRQRSGADHL